MAILEPQNWESVLASALPPVSCCFVAARFLGSKVVAMGSVGESKQP